MSRSNTIVAATAALALSLLLLPKRAMAQDPTPVSAEVAPPLPARGFGSRGQWVVSGAASLAYSSTSYEQSYLGASSLKLTPSIDYFVLRHWSVGLLLGYTVEQTTQPLDDQTPGGAGIANGSQGTQRDTISTLSGGARVGYDVPLGALFSIYSRATFGAESRTHTISQTNPAVFPDQHQSGLFGELDAMLLLHPVSHFFVGAGPRLRLESGEQRAAIPSENLRHTTLGADIVLGGHFGGEAEHDAAPPAQVPGDPPDATTAPQKVFGARNTFVISNDVVASAAYTTYDGTGASQTDFLIRPGVDWFFVNHVSLGGAFAVGDSRTKNGPGADGPSRGALGLEARIGGDLPLGSWLSFYPRASFGVRTATITSDPVASYSDPALFVGIFAPVLLHPTTHLFVGAGPSFATDLNRVGQSVGGSSAFSTKSTTLGVAYTVGGWL